MLTNYWCICFMETEVWRQKNIMLVIHMASSLNQINYLVSTVNEANSLNKT